MDQHFTPAKAAEFSLPDKRAVGVQQRDEPKIYQAHIEDEYDELLGDATGTDFSSWNEDELRAFLDQRGEDYDHTDDLTSLITQAKECEINTGPATRPNLSSKPTANQEDDDEIDPLDAFMAEMQQLEKTTTNTTATTTNAPSREQQQPAAKRPRREPKRTEADDEDDHMMDFIAARKRGAISNIAFTSNTNTNINNRFENNINTNNADYNSDDEVYATANAIDAAAGILPNPDDLEDYDNIPGGANNAKRIIEPLPPLDHTKITYPPFNKDFYEEDLQLTSLNPNQVADYRKTLGVRVSGYNVPKPVQTFQQCGFDKALNQTIIKAGYEKPTPIQAQALPAVLSGRDVLGIAKTGSGKTAAFVLPMIVHILDQPELGKGQGPIAVIVAPTRELAAQIHREARRFGKPFNIRVSAAFGGLSKHTQFKELKSGADAAVSTPGRLIDLIKMKACTLRHATYLVFDEADRMFDMGFEPQVRSIVGQIRPDRQTLLFSATMPRKISKLASEVLSSPIRITVGEIGAANEDIKQVVVVVESDVEKLRWLSARLEGFVDDGDLLVFCNQKVKVEEVTAALAAGSARVEAIHGDMDQATRMDVLHRYKSGSFHILVATDVAARGLDIRTIKTVVNYDAAKDADTHVHRVGRTGRAGDKEGVAYTLLLPDQCRAAADLVQCLVSAGQEVTEEVHELAMKDARFRNGMSRGRGGSKGGAYKGKGRRPKQLGGAGLGFAAPPSHTLHGKQGGGVGGSFESGQVTGFAKSHAAEDVHFAAAVIGGGGTNSNSQQQPPLPPMPPPEIPTTQTQYGQQQQYDAQQQQQRYSPTAAAAGGGVMAPQPPLPPLPTDNYYSNTVQPPLPPPQQQPPLPPPSLPPPLPQDNNSERPTWGETKRNYVQNNFRSGFVSSGTTGGDMSAKPEIVMPKISRPQHTASHNTNIAPPPVPVTQVPLYLQQQQRMMQGRGGAGNRYPNQYGAQQTGYGQQQQQPQVAAAQPPTAVQAEALQKAIEQAKAIAARLSGQGGGASGGK